MHTKYYTPIVIVMLIILFFVIPMSQHSAFLLHFK